MKQMIKGIDEQLNEIDALKKKEAPALPKRNESVDATPKNNLMYSSNFGSLKSSILSPQKKFKSPKQEQD